MEYLKVNGTEYPAHFCGKQIDRDWDGRASKTVTLAMPYAQAVQLFVDGLRWGIVRREAGADDAAQGQDCSGYCVAGPITDNRDGTLSIKMGSYTQLEQALRELEEALAGIDLSGYIKATEKGQPGGVATLGPDGKVPGEQLPDIGGFYEVEEAVPPASRKANTLYGLILADYTGTGGEG